jgi:predicted transcriptional regulator
MGVSQSNVLISKPRAIEDLKQRIKEEIAETPGQMARRVMENLRERSEQCLRNGGRHLNDDISQNKMTCTEFFNDSNCYVIT